MDLIRPLGMAGIRCVAVAEPATPPWFSRFVDASVPWVADQVESAEELIGRLTDFGLAQRVPPVLFYEHDWELLLVSRFRARLGGAFSFVIPPAALVDDLVDKARFQARAGELGLPVPRGCSFAAVRTMAPEDLDLRAPLIVKPFTRRTGTWRSVAARGAASEPKALLLSSHAELRELWPRMEATGEDYLLQEVIEGPESRIESYHAYVDSQGLVAGEFTGRKLRTFPPRYGYSTALVTTDCRDVADLGREVLARLDFRGVAKIDFKRDERGRLHLLEINPRFNLWHHLGAAAGINLPAIVYADLAGEPRPAAAGARAGARWCRLQEDARAARAQGISVGTWLRWAVTCDASPTLAWDDPMPFVRGLLWPRARALLARSHPPT